MSSAEFFNPKFELVFSDLYQRDGLIKLNQKFENFLQKRNPEIAEKFLSLKKYESQVLIDSARLLEDFLVDLFAIENQNLELQKRHHDLQKIYQARRDFVQRHVAKKFSQTDLEVLQLDGVSLRKDLEINHNEACDEIDDLEKKLAELILAKKKLETLELYSAWALYSKEGRVLHQNGALFILPKKIDQQNLIPEIEKNFQRNGFDLTDKGYSLNRAQGEAHYCIFCHRQNKDSCRSGINSVNQTQANLSEVTNYKLDSLGVELSGCPLDEKISEMNFLKSEGFSIAALAMAVIDNPMIAGTGHRICNDCMKSCIYQKQDPVDIPQIETRILKDVLSLPYGFEIYSLLTRWNPLNLQQKLPKENDGKKVLVCGLGPAGYTLAHYLLNDGYEVVAIDGLKIEPLNPQISGIDHFGNRCNFKPIKFLDEIYEPLSSRIIQGFGGVAEYGITVRWDKNFLKIIRLLLERRSDFRMFGGIRFGSSITHKIAFDLYGFDHVALCIGAGRPNIINIKNNFAKGIRAASDFLMSLQLTGAFKEELFTNLQIRMPIIVIGGGLTAVDSACEAQAYYFVQIKKFAKKVELLGKEKLWELLNEEEKNIAAEFLRDAEKLQREGKKNFPPVKILYRKKIQDSPAYRLNHQELAKAFEQGVEFVENIIPEIAELDEFGYIKGLSCKDGKGFECKSLIVAAGTTPNVSLVLEDNLDFTLDKKYFTQVGLGVEKTESDKVVGGLNFITKIDEESKKAVSFFGDLHPDFEGNVVKAMASARSGHKQISALLAKQNSHHKNKESQKFLRDYQKDFLVTIERIDRLSNHVVEVFINAPLLALQTQVGQIFRLQNYHSLAKKVGDQIMAMEGVAVTALSIDKVNGIISGIVLETGGSTSLIKNFKVGEPCIFMGPSGKPTEIPKNETVMFVGGGRGNQPLTALAQAFQANGCKVIFFAGYRKNSFVVREERMRKFSDQLIISIEDEEALSGRFQGSVVEAIRNYFSINHPKIDRVFAISNNRLMHEIAKLRHENFIPEIANAKFSITSLNAPMQCMMKGVCSQCLQKKLNEKGEIEYFYACSQQDQNSDQLDFEHLHWRCEQNSLAEKTSKLWIEYLESVLVIPKN